MPVNKHSNPHGGRGADKYDKSLVHDTASKFILHPSHPKQSHLNCLHVFLTKAFPQTPFHS